MEIEKRLVAGDDGDVAVLGLSGRLNMVAAPALTSAIDDVVQQTPKVVVDFSDVTFMDSSGLGAVIAGLKKARQAQGDLRIASPTEQVQTVLRLTNLDKVLRPRDSVEAACRDW